MKYKKSAIVFIAFAALLLQLNLNYKAKAAALTQSQISAIVALLQAFAVPSQTIQTIKDILAGNSYATQTSPQTTHTNDAAVSNNNCPEFKYYLSIGVSDKDTEGEVSKWQSFLKKEGYFNYEITGYYGYITARATVAWQHDHGLYDTDIYSGVGPRTRAAIKKYCQNVDEEMSQGAYAHLQAKIDQSEGSAPLVVNVTLPPQVSKTSRYIIDFGDGNTTAEPDCTYFSKTGLCAEYNTVSHIYKLPGLYKLSVKLMPNTNSPLIDISTFNINVQDLSCSKLSTSECLNYPTCTLRKTGACDGVKCWMALECVEKTEQN